MKLYLGIDYILAEGERVVVVTFVQPPVLQIHSGSLFGSCIDIHVETCPTQDASGFSLAMVMTYIQLRIMPRDSPRVGLDIIEATMSWPPNLELAVEIAHLVRQCLACFEGPASFVALQLSILRGHSLLPPRGVLAISLAASFRSSLKNAENSG